MSSSRNAFTVVELLIAVVLVAVLTAISLPNFQKAQTRSRVSSARADMRAIGVALEAYKLDTAHYPPDFQFYQWVGSMADPFAFRALDRLTTPTAYLTAVPSSPFRVEHGAFDGRPDAYGYKGDDRWRSIILGGMPALKEPLFHWIVVCTGPDERANNGEYAMFGQDLLNATAPFAGGGPGCLYDPTNGTRSAGDLVWIGPGPANP